MPIIPLRLTILVNDIIPSVIGNHRVFAYPFRDAQSGVQAYWRDVGTVDSYWAANMELIGVDPELNLYDREWPIWTYQAQTPPAKFIFDDDDRRGFAVDSMVSGGCIISGSEVRNSLLSAMCGSTPIPREGFRDPAGSEHRPVLPHQQGRHRRGCHIPPNTVIGENLEEDRKRFHVSSGGVVLVTPDDLGQRLHFAR